MPCVKLVFVCRLGGKNYLVNVLVFVCLCYFKNVAFHILHSSKFGAIC